MTRRYVTLFRPKADDEDYWANTEVQRNLTVFEPEPHPQDTGLLDKSGAPLYAIIDREPVGFIHWRSDD